MVKKELELIPKANFDKAVVKDDIILIFLNNRKFILCDKQFGIKQNKEFYQVLRVIGGGKSNAKDNK